MALNILIVDDSAVVRSIIAKTLRLAGVPVGEVHEAANGQEGLNVLESHWMDLVFADINMPVMNGEEMIRRIRANSVWADLPLIIISTEGSEAALRALELGAVDVIAKPGTSYSVAEISQMLVDRIRAAAVARRRIGKTIEPLEPCQLVGSDVSELPQSADGVLAIGASTGGTEAIKHVLLGLPVGGPGAVIVQHMPANFTAAFAERLNKLCLMEVREAQDNDSVMPGLALIAPGNRHMTLRRSGDRYRVEIKGGPLVRHQRPSVDVLFHSVAQQAGPHAVGVILTGMGDDGARGLLAMRQAGAFTLAQDRDSCVVFGMPKEAIGMEAVDKVAPLLQLPRHILQSFSRKFATEVACTVRAAQ